MSSTKLQRPEPHYFKQRLQAMFIAHLIKRPDCDAVLEPLKALWAGAELASYDAQTLREVEFEMLPRSVTEVLAYIEAVEECVGTRLRCRERGQSAIWVCRAIHGAVTGGIVIHLPEADTKYIVGDLLIPVFTTGSAAIGWKIDGHTIREPVSIPPDAMADETDDVEVDSSILNAFDDWDGLCRQAHSELDELLTELQTRVESVTLTWPRMQSSGVKARTLKTMSLLVDWLVGHESLWASDRPAAHQLLQKIGLDQPSRVKKYR